jgi:glycosyltransferase involved in cell wall biosynthesis
MKISVITPNFNGEAYLADCLKSIIDQRREGLDIEILVMDGGSTDGSADVVRSFGSEINTFVSEKDNGPCDAITKGLALATGDILAWLNADDLYVPGALARVAEVMSQHPERALCFGHCPIVNEQGDEIRHGITRFKEMFYPFSSRFVIQSINYISQPAMFFRRSAYEAAGPLRQDLKAAWDYEFILRLWKQGGAVRVSRPALAMFRWHPGSISGQHFKLQFKEEFDAAVADAGRFSIQALLHWFVRWGIVGSYSLMAANRQRAESSQ